MCWVGREVIPLAISLQPPHLVHSNCLDNRRTLFQLTCQVASINGCGSVVDSGRVGGVGKRMWAVDWKQEINLEWPNRGVAL